MTQPRRVTRRSPLFLAGVALAALVALGAAAGTWTVDPSIGSFADFSSSWVGYRVDETLAGNRANTAVGRTPDVTGTLVLEVGRSRASTSPPTWGP